MADELRGDGRNLKLDIVKTTTKTEIIRIRKDGKIIEQTPVGTPVTTYTFRTYSDLSKSPLQRMVVEYAVRRYQKRNNVANVFIEYPDSSGNMVKIMGTEFWSSELSEAEGPLSDEIAVKGTGKLENVDFKVYCSSGINQHREDFIVDFDKRSGAADPKIGLDVRMESSRAEKKYPTVIEITRDGNYVSGICKGKMYSIDEEVTTLTWPGPEIVKGAIG